MYTNEISGDDAQQGRQAGDSNIIFACNNHHSDHSASQEKNGLVWKSLAQLGAGFNYNKICAGIYFTPEANWFRGALTFFTNNSENSTGSPSERMRITRNGNVGIGTSEPLNHYLNSSSTGGSYSTNDRALTIYGNNPSTENGVARLIFSCNANHTASIFAQHTGDGNTHMGFLTTNGTTAPAERMRITRDGNVGIGTTSPGAKLDIRYTATTELDGGLNCLHSNGSEGISIGYGGILSLIHI